MEQWKPITGYEDLYEVSDRGRVRRKDAIVPMPTKWGGVTDRHVKTRILSARKAKTGYLHIALSKDGKHRTFLVHRLVAEAFVPPVEGKTCVNHKNLHKDDNRVENLEWCTYHENTQHMMANGALKQNSQSKRIRCIEKGLEFPSSYQAAAWLNDTYFGNKKDIRCMSRTIRHATKSHGTSYGFHWKDVVEPSTTSA